MLCGVYVYKYTQKQRDAQYIIHKETNFILKFASTMAEDSVQIMLKINKKILKGKALL